MYYELYIDVLFLVNFMMDYLLLLTVGRTLNMYCHACVNFYGSIDNGSNLYLCGHLHTGASFSDEIHFVPYCHKYCYDSSRT